MGVVIKDGLIDTLVLKRQGLEELPDYLCDLSGIKMIVLSENKLTSLPKSFANLTSLEFINLKM